MILKSPYTLAAFWAAIGVATVLSTSLGSAQEPTPGYNNKIPESIMTPNKVKTRIGTLKFFDGIPTKDTAALLYDNLDFLRGVETFLNGMPATSLEGLRRGQVELGAKNSNQAVVFDKLMDSNPLFLTGNTDTSVLPCLPRPEERRGDGC